MVALTKFVDLVRFNFEKFNMPSISWTDVVEIFVIAVLIYKILQWFKESRAVTLMKGIGVIIVFVIFAEVFEMNAILWIVNKLFTIAATVIVVVFQPELRRALEQIGKKKYLSELFDPQQTVERFSDHTLESIIRACNEMAKVRTGALIVIEQTSPLTEIEKTGIRIDGNVSSQLLINIFEHNTPLHDGAVVIRNDRITYATCYLPLSSDMSLSKELGTRHRAGLGMSEAGDSLTVIVSEETGRISLAYEGKLMRNVDQATFRHMLEMVQNKTEIEKKRFLFKPVMKDKTEKPPKADRRKNKE